MYTLRWTPTAAETYRVLRASATRMAKARRQKGKRKTSRAEGLFKQVHKTIELLRSNPRHPGLNRHEYDSMANPFDGRQKVFEEYAQNKTPGVFRVFWCYGPAPKEMTIIAITAHP